MKRAGDPPPTWGELPSERVDPPRAPSGGLARRLALELLLAQVQGGPAPRLGRYEVLAKLGEGGMGAVYRGRDVERGREVALKVLHLRGSTLAAAEAGRGADDSERFAREARILSGLDHPHIVRYLSHGLSDEGDPYLVMEWLDGEDLAARLGRGALEIEQSVALALRVAEALAFAHARGVVHRDLKPSNLFLPNGRVDAVKVLDFGIASGPLNTRVTRTGTLMGTAGYMAPEQARGEARVDARADVFSLGCVLFECLSGAPAFGGEHAVAVLTRVLFQEPPSVRALRPEVPEALESLLGRMLAKRPEDRPADGRAVAAGLTAMAGSNEGAPRAAQPRSMALTGSEQQSVAVILVGTAVGGADPDREGDLLREAARHGGLGERLLDGSVAAVLTGAGQATDLCARAARCALALLPLAGGRAVALTLTRGEPTGRAMGSAVDRAARLWAGPAARNAVRLDGVAAGLLDARFDVRDDDGAYLLLGERETALGTRTLLGKPTPCVGREREIAQIDLLYRQCVDEGSPHVAIITAPPGAGKSRLAHEVLSVLRASSPPPLAWIGRGDPFRAGSPLGLLAQTLRSATGVIEGEPLETRRERVRATVAAALTGSDAERVTAFLGEIAGAPFPDDSDIPLRAARRDAQLLGEQVKAAFLDFVAASCARRPVVLVLEDLHWSDRATVQLIEVALRRLADKPFFVLALARPELHDHFPRLWEDRAPTEIRLKALGRRAIEGLALHVLGDAAEPAMLERLVQLSEGNAFYLEELLRWWAEGLGPELPETVVAMVQSRLGSLDEPSRRALRAASVFGDALWPGAVAALLGEDDRLNQVRARLRDLAEREILVRRHHSRFPGEEEFAFRHALLREGAYSMLTDNDRALGHRLAGRWLEARGEQDGLLLAEHFEKGGDDEAAGRQYLAAARQAGWRSGAQESAALARRGLGLPVSEPLRHALLGALCEAAVWQPEIALGIRAEAEALAASADLGSAIRAQASLACITAAFVTHELEEVLARTVALQSEDFTPETSSSTALALTSSVYALSLAGRTADADALLSTWGARLQDDEDGWPVHITLIHLLRSTMGEWDDDPTAALRHAEAAGALARQIGHRHFEGIAQLGVGLNRFCLGDFDRAAAILGSMPVADADLGGASSIRCFVLAWLAADQGDHLAARAFAEELVTAGGARGLPLDQGRGHWALAEALRRAGDLDGAEVQVEAALGLLAPSVQLDMPGLLATKAALRLDQGRQSEALALAEDAMARHAQTRMCSHFFRGAFLRLVRVDCLVQEGRAHEAREALAAARTRLDGIASKIDDPALRESFLTRVPENRRTASLML